MVDGAAPGWYPDPDPREQQAGFRWWDGRQWMAAVTADPSSPPPGAPRVDPAAIRLSRARVLVIVGAFLAGCGSIGPWAKLSAPLVEETVMVVGTDGDGVITLIGALLIAGLGLLAFGPDRWHPAPVVTLAVAAVVGFIAVVDILQVDTRVPEFKAEGAGGRVNASLQPGLWLVLVGAATAIVASVLYLRARSRPTP